MGFLLLYVCVCACVCVCCVCVCVSVFVAVCRTRVCVRVLSHLSMIPCCTMLLNLSVKGKGILAEEKRRRVCHFGCAGRKAKCGPTENKSLEEVADPGHHQHVGHDHRL